MQQNKSGGSPPHYRDGIYNGVYHTEFDGRLAHQREWHPRQRYQKFEWDKYSPYQNELYKKTIFGIKVYTEEERKKLSPQQILIINKNHSRVQRVLNIFKQQVTNKICNHLLNILFYKSPMARALQQKKYTRIDPDHHNTIPFDTLGITKDQIIERLITEKLLPEDFHQLQKKPKTLKPNGSTFHSERRSFTPA